MNNNPLIVRKESKERTLILVSGFIHDVSTFTDKHPGGSHFLIQNSGEDMTASFFGGVYAHSNAAHNVRSMP
jgi:stearoyl-CoA desaturase (delta-9 desaturase)